MAVLSADANVSLVGGNPAKISGPAAIADTYWGGAILVALNVHTTGCVSCVPTSGTAERILGICSKKQIIAAQYDLVEYYVGGIWLIPAIATIDKTEIGSYLVIDKSGTPTDNVADLLGSGDITPASGDAIFGRIVGLDAASNIYVDCNLMGAVMTVTTLALM